MWSLLQFRLQDKISREKISLLWILKGRILYITQEKGYSKKRLWTINILLQNINTTKIRIFLIVLFSNIFSKSFEKFLAWILLYRTYYNARYFSTHFKFHNNSLRINFPVFQMRILGHRKLRNLLMSVNNIKTEIKT